MKLSKKDWTQLSAYLDGELSQRDAKKLQTRIEGNPDFQAALENLQTVKAVLSKAPRLPVPRNFTLRRSLVESPQKRTAPVRGYRLAAAVLSFLFIGVVVLDMGSVMLKGRLSASFAPREEEVMLEAAVEEMEEPAMMLAKEAGDEEIASEVEMEEAPVAPENLEAGMEGETGVLEVEPTQTVGEEADRAAVAEGEYYGEESQDSQNLLAEDEEIDSEEAQTPPEQEMDQADEIPSIPWLRILEIVLGLGAIGFGTTAWINRRKSRKS